MFSTGVCGHIYAWFSGAVCYVIIVVYIILITAMHVQVLPMYCHTYILLCSK